MCHDTLSPTVPPARLMRLLRDLWYGTVDRPDPLMLDRFVHAQGDDVEAELAEPVTGFTKCPVCTCTLSNASRLPCSGCAS